MESSFMADEQSNAKDPAEIVRMVDELEFAVRRLGVELRITGCVLSDAPARMDVLRSQFEEVAGFVEEGVGAALDQALRRVRAQAQAALGDDAEPDAIEEFMLAALEREDHLDAVRQEFLSVTEPRAAVLELLTGGRDEVERPQG